MVSKASLVKSLFLSIDYSIETPAVLAAADVLPCLPPHLARARAGAGRGGGAELASW